MEPVRKMGGRELKCKQSSLKTSQFVMPQAHSIHEWMDTHGNNAHVSYMHMCKASKIDAATQLYANNNLRLSFEGFYIRRVDRGAPRQTVQLLSGATSAILLY